MPEQFYELEPDIFAEHVPELQPELDAELSLTRGRVIGGGMPDPLIYITGHTADDPPKGLHNRCDPVMSDELISALIAAGVSNLQCFPAELHSENDGSVWRNYKAVNVIGLVRAADMANSTSTEIIERPGENAPALVAFESLRVDPARVGSALLFRLAESPSTLIVAGRVVDYLLTLHSDEDWGITLEAVS